MSLALQTGSERSPSEPILSPDVLLGERDWAPLSDERGQAHRLRRIDDNLMHQISIRH